MTRTTNSRYHHALHTAHPNGIPPHRIVFHYFHGGRHLPSQGSISAATFEAIIDFVDADNILSADEWLARAMNDSLTLGDVCLGFDDALRCQYDVALPVLRKRKITAQFFINTHVVTGGIETLEIYRHFRNHSFASLDMFHTAFEKTVRSSRFEPRLKQGLSEFDPRHYLSDFPFYSEGDRRFRYIRDLVLGPEAFHEIMSVMMADAAIDVRSIAEIAWMNEECVRTLHNERHIVGLHGHHHPTKLDALSLDEQYQEYADNGREVLRMTGTPARIMSHPCNSYSQDTLRILQELNIRVGFRGGMHGPYHGGLEHATQDPAVILAMPEFND